MKKLTCIFVILIILLTACARRQSPANPSDTVKIDTVSAATMQRYRPGELRQYDGQKLDPLIGPSDSSIAGVKQVDMTSYNLVIDGLVQTPKQFRYSEVTAMPSQIKPVTMHSADGWDATILWKGVLMQDLLNAAGVKPEAKTVIFHCTDGSTASVPLREILDKKLMLAWGANGLPLPPEMGYPFIFVAEDQWGAKWARWVTHIELS